MLNVVVVNDTGHVNGGAAAVAILSALALSKLGVQVTFVCMVPPIDARLTIAGIRVVCFGGVDLLSANRLSGAINGLWNVEAKRKLLEVLEPIDTRNAIVHFHGYYKALSASVLRASKDAGFRVTATLHDYFSICPNGGLYNFQRQESCTLKPMGVSCLTTDCDSRRFSHKIWRSVRHTVAERCNASLLQFRDVIFVSQYSKSILAPKFDHQTRWHYVANPIDVEEESRTEAEKNSGFVFVGRVTQEKGVDLFCEAVRLTGQKGCVVGDGPMLSTYRDRYPEVEFAGWCAAPDVKKIVRGFRALVVPSRWHETQGLVVLECAALGVPSIVADRTAAADYIQDEETGLLFKNGDVTSLVAAMKRIGNSALTLKLSYETYHQFWKSAPTLDLHGKQLLHAYREILAPH